MDEVSKRKGHRDFVTVVSDVERGCLIEVIDSHKQLEIIEVLKKQEVFSLYFLRLVRLIVERLKSGGIGDAGM